MRFPRYERYKDSGVEWLGEVPEHWQVRSFRYSARIMNGTDFKHLEVEEGGYPVVGSGGPFARVSQYMYDKPSVLLGRKGTIDKPLYMESPFWAVDTMYYTEIAADSVPKFVYYYSKCIPFDLFTYGSALPSMTQTTLHALAMPLPNPHDQTAIVLFLDAETAKIDALIEEQRRLIELLKEKRQAVISHAVTKGLNRGAPMKHSGLEWLGEIPAHWQLSRVKRLTKIISKGTTPTTIGADFTDTGVRFLKAENITAKGVSSEPEFYISTESNEMLSRSILTENDVLVVIAGATTGKSAILPLGLTPANTNQAVSFVRLREPRYAKFVNWWLSVDGIQKSVLLNSVQSAQPNLSMQDLGNLIIVIPPVEELSEICELLERQLTALDLSLADAESLIGLLVERRSALISAAVTGKIDVRNYTPKEAA